MISVGIDTSLTNTGIVQLHGGTSPYAHILSVPTKSDGKTLVNRQERLEGIAHLVFEYAAGADIAVIEAPAYASKMGSAHDRSGLWWLAVDKIIRNKTKVVEIPPTTRAKYATGKGNAGKDQVLLAVAKRYPDFDVTNNDEADALVLAMIGMRLLGKPLDDVPAINLEGLKKVSLD